MQYRRPHRGFTPAAIADIRHRIENTDEPQSMIAADYGVHRKTIQRLAQAEGMVMRKDRGPRDLPADVRLDLEAEQAVHALAEASVAADQAGEHQAGEAQERSVASAPERPSVAERLERAVEKELAAVEIRRARLGSQPQPPADAERTTRILERLTDTLFKAQRLRSPDLPVAATNDFDMPQDINEFRHALANRIEKFVRSWSARAVPATGDPTDGASSQ